MAAGATGCGGGVSPGAGGRRRGSGTDDVSRGLCLDDLGRRCSASAAAARIAQRQREVDAR